MPPFVVANFLEMYPQFVGVFSDAQIEAIYTNESLIVGSKLLSLFSNTNTQFYYAQLVLAHILTIYQLGLTGRPSNVSEGSVSGAFENGDTVDNSWWGKTVYGQQCWKVIQNRGGATLFSSLTNIWYPSQWFPF